MEALVDDSCLDLLMINKGDCFKLILEGMVEKTNYYIAFLHLEKLFYNLEWNECYHF